MGHMNVQPEYPAVADLKATSPKRILVLRPGGLGDLIILLPILHQLRQECPSLIIDLVCEKRNAEVVALDGVDVNVLLYDTKPFAFLAHLRSQNYDAVIDAEQFHHFSAVFAMFSGAPTRIGFGINPRRNPLYTHLVKYEMDGREGHQFMRLLEPLGLGDTPYSLDGLFPDEPGDPIADETVQALDRNRLTVALCPGAASRHKAWDLERMAIVIELLVKENQFNVVLLGGDVDRAAAVTVAARADLPAEHLANAVGGLSLRGTLRLLKRSCLYIGCDTGLAHLAAAAGLPTVVLFGSSDPDKWGVQDETHRVVKEDIACSPCAMFGYYKPCDHIACMRRITVAKVMEAVELLTPDSQPSPERAASKTDLA